MPLVLAGNKPGHEIEYPMAVVILGGLITSTVLNLVLIPALYARFGKLAGNLPSEFNSTRVAARLFRPGE